MNTFKIAAGNLPTLTDTLTDDSGPVDLTGATVVFAFQGPGVSYSQPATITGATAGTVQYTFLAGQTAVTGLYEGQWQVTEAGGNVRAFPSCPFEFEITPMLPVPPVTQCSKLSDLFDDVRALTGDFDRQLYEDSAIANVMRMKLRLGVVRQDCRRWTVGPDGQTISPAILDTDTHAYGVLIYHTALTLVAPNIAAYSYRTRAASERFGEARDFLAEMKNALYELENGDGVWATVTGLRSTLFAVNGIWAWSYLQAQNNIDLSFHS